MYVLTKWFGWWNLIPAVIGIFSFPWLKTPEFYAKESLFTVLLLQVLVGGALVYSSQQKIARAGIAETIYPASIVAYILFMSFTLRTFGYWS